MRSWRKPAVAAAAALLTGLGLAGPAVAVAVAHATHDVVLQGSGSSWAAPAINVWSRDLARRGILVNFNPDGSAQGLADYIQGQDDFAASDVPFRSGRDKLAGLGAQHSPYGYSYVPDVAGGTAFAYHLRVNGHLITNLRLTGALIMKIFTGRIRNWDNRQITQVYGRQLPSLPIVPVVHAEGAGDTFFLTRWMAVEFPRQWNAFCRLVTHGEIKNNCGPTEFYPISGWSPSVKAENGSANVVDFIASRYGNGAIGYDEFSYAVEARVPVVRLRNPAGRYVLPTAASVSAALTAAQIVENPASPEFLQQNLNNVYTFRNPISYPLSSYSYLVVPRAGTRLPPPFSRAKGRALSRLLALLLCPAGQRQVRPLGYAPLPANLVRGGLLQAARIPGHIRLPQLHDGRCVATS
jgi:ABC-type phosphate transport system substrate-binding protein